MQKDQQETVNWLNKMEKGDRTVSLLILAAFGLASSLVVVFTLYRIESNKNQQLQTNATNALVDCEKRVSSEVVLARADERRRADSTIAADRKETRAYFLQRESVVDAQTDKIYKRIKK